MADDRSDAGAPRVVLIEDDPLVRLGQEMLLRDWGYRVAVGASRDAVFAELEAAPHDVAAIITDYNVGGPETGDLIALAIAASAGRAVPTMIMSASFGRASAAAAQANGFAFLSKPVDPSQLRDWLAEVTACDRQ
jgi:CheY-like chemotaxis protein